MFCIKSGGLPSLQYIVYCSCVLHSLFCKLHLRPKSVLLEIWPNRVTIKQEQNQITILSIQECGLPVAQSKHLLAGQEQKHFPSRFHRVWHLKLISLKQQKVHIEMDDQTNYCHWHYLALIRLKNWLNDLDHYLLYLYMHLTVRGTL